MKKITPHHNVYGHVDHYTVTDVDMLDINASVFLQKIKWIIIALIPILFYSPITAPIIFFVTKHKLKYQYSRHNKLLKAINIIALIICIYWILTTVILLGEHLGIFQRPPFIRSAMSMINRFSVLLFIDLAFDLNLI